MSKEHYFELYSNLQEITGNYGEVADIHIKIEDKDIDKEKEEGDKKINFPELQNQWNEFAKKYELKEIKAINDSRKEKLRTRFKEPEFAYEDILKAITEQSFLRGKNQKNWKVEFDWIIENDKNYLKILERKYVDHSPTPQPLTFMNL